ncbi:MAG: hypothetical protein HC918_04135 [Oscillatoriales cyanobacterium SM2_1_8]|nr:hypothetical protein [Oscillatoriales cyanobacterium SM2_1_8]
MPTFSQQDYWDCIGDRGGDGDPEDGCGQSWRYRYDWGEGSGQAFSLEEGFYLDIGHINHRQPVQILTAERSHPIEYAFAWERGTYHLWGSGLAPAEVYEIAPMAEWTISVHLDVEIFLQHLAVPKGLTHLVRSPIGCTGSSRHAQLQK